MADILIIDDEEDIRALIAGVLEDEHYNVRTAHNSDSAKESYLAQKPHAVILDIWLKDSDMDGLKLLSYFKSIHRDVPIIIISGHGTIDMAVEATKIGAYSFISKPFKVDEILYNLSRALEESYLKEQHNILKQQIHNCYLLKGESPIAKKLNQAIDHHSNHDTQLTIFGDKGIGKETLARHIHAHSSRKLYPCRYLHGGHSQNPHDIAQLLLGDSDKKTGLLENTNGGTLLLEDPHELPQESQQLLAQFLQNFNFTRLNSNHAISSNIRIITLISDYPNKEEWKPHIQPDLYVRLAIHDLTLLNLEARHHDIAAIIHAITSDIASYHHVMHATIDDDAMAVLCAYPWYGNIWECRHVMERLLLQAGHDSITKEQVLTCLYHKPNNDENNLLAMMQYPLKEAKELFEQEYINYILTKHNGNVSQAAQYMDIDRVSLHRKMKQQKNTKIQH